MWLLRALLLTLLFLPLLVPALSLLVLTLASLRRTERGEPAHPTAVAFRTVVLIPAHNESHHLLPTLACVKSQLGPGDSVLVIADNCDDDTAQQARNAGANVIERHDPSARGKGYALACGVEQLRRSPPDAVLILDADCLLSTGGLARLASKCLSQQRPVQAQYLMSAGANASLRHRVLEFAMLMKNQVRPLGTSQLGQACHLTGSGMAFPWPLIATAPLASGHIVEDMELGIALALAGHAPQLLNSVRVSSSFPLDSAAAKVQKTRWEHGHLSLLTHALPRLTRAAWRTGRRDLWVLALDLLIPPVALYTLTLGGTTVLAVLAAWSWPVWRGAAVLNVFACLCLTTSILCAWSRYARHLLHAGELLRMPLYAIWKVPVYLAYLMRKRSGWVRTKRDSE